MLQMLSIKIAFAQSCHARNEPTTVQPQDYASRGIIADTLLTGKLGLAEECSSGYRSKQPIASSGLARHREPLALILIYISVPGAL
jgi:hypothetical protein